MLDTRPWEPPRLRRMGGDDDAMLRPLCVPTAYGGGDRFELQRCNSEEGYVSLRDIVGSPEYAAAAASAGRTAIRDPLVKHAACAYLRLVPPHPPRRRCCGRGRSLVRRFFDALPLLFRGCAMDPLRCFGRCSRGHSMNL